MSNAQEHLEKAIQIHPEFADAHYELALILKDKKARNARSPKTGELIRIRARRVLTFKPSKILLDSTNGTDDSGNS